MIVKKTAKDQARIQKNLRINRLAYEAMERNYKKMKEKLQAEQCQLQSECSHGKILKHPKPSEFCGWTKYYYNCAYCGEAIYKAKKVKKGDGTKHAKWVRGERLE